VIDASAPVRICDIGGWTDTWFGGPGRVVNIAVRPGVHVTLRRVTGVGPVVINLPDFGERYAVTPGAELPARHPLVEGAVDLYASGLPAPVEIKVSSAVPPGCATGTSASVAVAVVGALLAASGRSWSRQEIAGAAHRLEVEVLGGESGVQDQLSAVFGGINHLSIDEYPEAAVEALPAWPKLESLLSVVYLGRAHRSSDVHRQVIERLEAGNKCPLDRLRAAADAACHAVAAQDVAAFGRAMTANTAAQAELHPELVGADARAVIDTARHGGALGWKVNGAGGDGGSVTLLSSTSAAKSVLEQRVAALDSRYRVLYLLASAEGLIVRGSL
jgi:D-glycero-alpha-D-manno-heptose-7-phosphate kinase